MGKASYLTLTSFLKNTSSFFFFFVNHQIAKENLDFGGQNIIILHFLLLYFLINDFFLANAFIPNLMGCGCQGNSYCAHTEHQI